MKKLVPFLFVLVSCKPPPPPESLLKDGNGSRPPLCESMWKIPKGKKSCWFYLNMPESCQHLTREFVMKAFSQKGLHRTTQPVFDEDILKDLRSEKDVENDFKTLEKNKLEAAAKFEYKEKFVELDKERLAIRAFKNTSTGKIDLYHDTSTRKVADAIRSYEVDNIQPSCQYLEGFN